MKNIIRTLSYLKSLIPAKFKYHLLFKSNFAYIIIAFSLLVPSYLAGDIIQVGNGSYTTDLPAGGNPPQYQNGTTAYPAITPNVSGPIPTNDWWTSLVYKNNVGNNYSEVLAAHPLNLKCKAQGLGIGVTDASAGNYNYPYNEEIIVGISNISFPNTLLDDYGDWTVKAKWENGSNSLYATFGHGLSFVYFSKNGGDASLNFISTPSIWYNQNGVLGVTINGHHYGIFAPTGSTWNISGNIFESNLNGNDYFSLAVLPNSSTTTLNFFQDHAYAFITDSQVSWNYNENNSLLTTTYQVTTQIKEGTEDQPLLALFRHQWLNCNATFTNYTHPSPRGLMRLYEGSSFSTEMPFMGIIPGFTNELAGSSGYQQTQLEGYIQTLAGQSIDQLIPYNDTYFHGKDLGKVAQVVRIADQIGDISARDYFLTCLKSRLENWLTASAGESSNLFYFNETWGTLVGFPSSFASDTQLNDHHFHWGYFIMAAATIAQYDIVWASETLWGGMVNMLIRDVAAWDRNDSLFPFLRNYDIYAGHSWAGGTGATDSGNNQESSSESLNFSAGVALWGSAIGNDEIRDLGIYLYTNEYHAVEQYWFDVDNEVFPVSFPHNCVGIVWGTGGSHSTWFSGEPEMIHGINFLPLTSASLYLGRNPGYIIDNYNEMVAENGGPENEWYDIIWEFIALSDPDLALSKFNDYPDYPVEGGETRAHTYYWLHNLKAMGQVDLSVTANVANYAVFCHNGTNTYLAYNPTYSPITVQFSDGETLEVPARQLVSSNSIMPAPIPTEPADSVISLFSNTYTNVPVDTWSADWDQADVTDIQLAGNDTKKYTNLIYAGVEFTSPTIDATDMNFFHMDVWTADDTSSPAVFKVKLVDFGADGSYGGGDDVEHEITFDENTMATGEWIELNIPMSDFTNLVTREHLAQLLISGDPNTVYVDNVYFSSITTSIDDEIQDSNYTLGKNYPNPFKAQAQTTINFSLVHPSKVSVKIYNIKGQLIKVLADREFGAAEHSVVWDGSDNSGRKVSEGVYFYKMQAPGFTCSKKMILMKL